KLVRVGDAQPAVVPRASSGAVEESGDRGGLRAHGPDERPLRQDPWINDLAGDDPGLGIGGVEGERGGSQADLPSARKASEHGEDRRLRKAADAGLEPDTLAR